MAPPTATSGTSSTTQKTPVAYSGRPTLLNCGAPMWMETDLLADRLDGRRNGAGNLPFRRLAGNGDSQRVRPRAAVPLRHRIEVRDLHRGDRQLAGNPRNQDVRETARALQASAALGDPIARLGRKRLELGRELDVGRRKGAQVAGSGVLDRQRHGFVGLHGGTVHRSRHSERAHVPGERGRTTGGRKGAALSIVTGLDATTTGIRWSKRLERPKMSLNGSNRPRSRTRTWASTLNGSSVLEPGPVGKRTMRRTVAVRYSLPSRTTRSACGDAGCSALPTRSPSSGAGP